MVDGGNVNKEKVGLHNRIKYEGINIKVRMECWRSEKIIMTKKIIGRIRKESWGWAIWQNMKE